ncbi:MAG: hypothetical protein U0V49_04240 [Saprospiraceae bacterium]
MMKITLVSALFLLVGIHLLAQDVIYEGFYNSCCVPGTKDQFKYRKVIQREENGYALYFYDRQGRKQIRYELISTDPEIADGTVLEYSASGRIRKKYLASGFLLDCIDNSSIYSVINDATLYGFKIRSADTLDALLRSGLLKTNQQISDVILNKARIISDIYTEEKDSLTDLALRIQAVDDISKLYDLSILKAPRQKYVILHDKIEWMSGLPFSDSYISAAKEEINKAGIRGESANFDIQFSLSRGRNSWIGLNASFYGKRRYQWKGKQADTLRQYYITPGFASKDLSISFVNFGVHQCINRNLTDLSFSTLNLRSPIYINVLNIGLTGNLNEAMLHFYYRPEIGWTWKNLSLVYGYNLVFQKKYRAGFEKNILSLKFTLPLFKLG